MFHSSPALIFFPFTNCRTTSQSPLVAIELSKGPILGSSNPTALWIFLVFTNCVPCPIIVCCVETENASFVDDNYGDDAGTSGSQQRRSSARLKRKHSASSVEPRAKKRRVSTGLLAEDSPLNLTLRLDPMGPGTNTQHSKQKKKVKSKKGNNPGSRSPDPGSLTPEGKKKGRVLPDKAGGSTGNSSGTSHQSVKTTKVRTAKKSKQNKAAKKSKQNNAAKQSKQNNAAKQSLAANKSETGFETKSQSVNDLVATIQTEGSVSLGSFKETGHPGAAKLGKTPTSKSKKKKKKSIPSHPLKNGNVKPTQTPAKQKAIATKPNNKNNTSNNASIVSDPKPKSKQKRGNISEYIPRKSDKNQKTNQQHIRFTE